MNLMGVAAFFSNLWMNIWISLNAMVYQLIEWLYEVFEVIANVNLFSREAFDDITGRLYVVIGIAMLFIFAYNIILMIINPEDKKNIGNTGKIVKETITALVLIILLPMIFNYMAIFQRNILDSHILEQIILGSTAGTGVKCDFSDMSLIDDYVKVKDDSAIKEMTDECNKYKSYKVSKQGAYSVAPTIFTAFFHPKYYSYDECVTYLKECNSKGTSCVSGKITTDDDKELCAHYVYSSNMGQFKGGIMPFTTNENTVFSDAWSDKGLLDFNYIMSLIAGCLGVWMFVCYSMAIGVRIAKLGFLQIISPIPVMLRMIPKQKEKIYDKWFSHLINAYLDVFIRLAIIYFCLFAISLVPDVMKSLFSSLEGDWFGTKALAAVIVILGILQFAQEAPALIKEFFGSSGAFALKSPKKQLTDNKLAMGAMGAVGGMATGAVKNFGKGSMIAGATSGLFRGAKAGYKSNSFKNLKANVSEAADQVVQAREARDERSKFEWKDDTGNIRWNGKAKGAFAYRAYQADKSWKRWISSESYASLNSQKNNVKEMSDAYNKAFDFAEAKLDEKSTQFYVGQYNYNEYKQMAERANEEYKNFDKEAYIRRRVDSGISEDAARIEADRRLEELLRRSTAANDNLTKVKEALVDAMLAHKGNEWKEKPDNLAVELKKVVEDASGKFVYEVDKSLKEVVGKADIPGLSEAITEATNAFNKNSDVLTEDTKTKIEGKEKTVRNIRGALKGELAGINAKLADLSELKKDDKK